MFAMLLFRYGSRTGRSSPVPYSLSEQVISLCHTSSLRMRYSPIPHCLSQSVTLPDQTLSLSLYQRVSSFPYSLSPRVTPPGHTSALCLTRSWSVLISVLQDVLWSLLWCFPIAGGRVGALSM